METTNQQTYTYNTAQVASGAEKKTLSLVIPCYNEERTLRSIVEKILHIQQTKIHFELVIVDDCSKDNSLFVAKQLEQEYTNVKVFQHEKNMGKGAALRTGFFNATGDFIGIQDADMEYNPEDYLIMLETLLDGKADVVYGSRYLRPDTRHVLFYWHTWMNKTLTKFSNMFTNLDITDMETCYKLFKKEVIKGIAPKLKENRFGFEPEITAYVANGNYTVYECAIQYNPRTVEEGKKINWKDGIRALYCIFHYSASTAPVPMQLILYFFIGGFCALANLIVFLLFANRGIAILYATLGAYVISAAINYLLCIAILFRHKARWSSAVEVVVYIIILAVMGGFDYAITNILICTGVSAGLGKALSSLVGFVINYILRKCVVFPEKKRKN